MPLGSLMKILIGTFSHFFKRILQKLLRNSFCNFLRRFINMFSRNSLRIYGQFFGFFPEISASMFFGDPFSIFPEVPTCNRFFFLLKQLITELLWPTNFCFSKFSNIDPPKFWKGILANLEIILLMILIGIYH